MRDGTVLHADVYRPKDGSYPVILMRLPYNKDGAQTYVYAPPEFYASHCYIVVIQDVRGQYASEGEFYPFRDEASDGYDTIEWAASCPARTARSACTASPMWGRRNGCRRRRSRRHLVTIVPAMTSSDYYDGWTYEGGAWSLAFEESWPLVTIALSGSPAPRRSGSIDQMKEAVRDLSAPTSSCRSRTIPGCSQTDQRVAPYFYDWIEHDTWDDYWKQWSIRTRFRTSRCRP